MKQRLTILGEPTAQKRKASRRIGEFSQVYDPSKEAKANFLITIQENAPEIPWVEPLRVETYFYFQRPKYHYGTGRNAGKLKSSAPRWHIKRPDIDNCQKFLYDSMSKKYWRDDTIICYNRGVKLYDQKPRIEIVICSIDEPTPDVYLQYFGYLAMQHVKTLEGLRKKPDFIDSRTLAILKGLVRVSIPNSAKLSDTELFEAVAWLNSNYKLEGTMK